MRRLCKTPVLVVLSVAATGSLNRMHVERTSYMFQAGEPIVYQYVRMDHISRFLVASTLVHEDDQLGTRVGAFDWDAFWARAQAYTAGQPDPSGSTIPQQLVKNIYLWPNQDPVRKGIEAVLSEEVDFMVPKKRIMELHLNYAQFGPKLFGVCAATWYYFNTPPSAVTEYQAAQLMGVLPLPDKVNRAPGGGIDLGPNCGRQGGRPGQWRGQCLGTEATGRCAAGSWLWRRSASLIRRLTMPLVWVIRTAARRCHRL